MEKKSNFRSKKNIKRSFRSKNRSFSIEKNIKRNFERKFEVFYRRFDRRSAAGAVGGAREPLRRGLEGAFEALARRSQCGNHDGDNFPCRNHDQLVVAKTRRRGDTDTSLCNTLFCNLNIRHLKMDHSHCNVLQSS